MGVGDWKLTEGGFRHFTTVGVIFSVGHSIGLLIPATVIRLRGKGAGPAWHVTIWDFWIVATPGSTSTDRPSVAFFFNFVSLCLVMPCLNCTSCSVTSLSAFCQTQILQLVLSLSFSIRELICDSFLACFSRFSSFLLLLLGLLFFLVAMEGATCPFSTSLPSTIAAASVRSASAPASVRVRALPSPSPTSLHFPVSRYEEGDLDCPRWAGDDPLSRFVSWLIAIKPLYNIMKVGARQVLIGTAEKNGVRWRGMSDRILASDVYAEKELLENKSVVYPDYYLREFHAYEEGNLSWKAASEVAPATLSMMLRAIPTAQSATEATQILRGAWLQAIDDHHQTHSGGLGVSAILDIGCSIGDSTRALADWFTSAHITGLDLSPYFLAVAQHMEKQRASTGLAKDAPISWVHANGECTGFPASSFDVVSLAFVIHECPQHAIRGLLKESFRILKPGGTVSLTDNSPKSKVIQNLPPAIFTLMKSTEPWMDEYYTFDLEGAMESIGFSNVNSVLTDPRHRTVTATVPLARR